jgi:hypothetical protein
MKSTRIVIAGLLAFVFTSGVHAEGISLNAVTMMRRLSRIQELTQSIPPAGERETAAASRAVKPAKGAEMFYRNGVRATWDGNGEWFYPNGKRATWRASETGQEWFWPNGQRATWRSGTAGAEWFYPNGRRVSWQIGQPGAEFFYSNGQRMTWSGPGIANDELLNAPKLMLWLLWVDGMESSPF